MAEFPRQDNPLARKLSAEQLDLILRELHAVPPNPAILITSLELLSESDSAGSCEGAIARLSELACCDPAITARLLSLAGRGRSEEVWSLGEVIEQLGLDAVRAEILSYATSPSDSGPENPLDPSAFGKHCLAVGLAAEMLGDAISLPMDPKRAFVCGLLHDLGKLALAQCFPKSYARVLVAAEQQRGNIAKFERDILGADHTVAGRRLAQQWGLADLLQKVIWLHHQPPEAIVATPHERMMIVVVQLADALVRRAGIGVSGNCAPVEGEQELARVVGLSQRLLSAVMDQVDGEVRKRTGWFMSDRPGRLAQAGPEAIRELAELNEQLRVGNEAISLRGKAFDHLLGFADKLTSDVTVAEVLCRIAASLAAIENLQPTTCEPVIAYAFGVEADVAFAVRYDGREKFAWRALQRRTDSPAQSQAATSASGGEVAAAVFADEAALGDWANLSNYAHQQLTGQGRWVGGLFYPGGGGTAGTSGQINRVGKDLAGILATTLAIVQDRCKAVGLSEQLAGASQRLSDAQQTLVAEMTRESVGQIAAGAAHELNNPLAVVSGRAQLMAQKATDSEDRKVWSLIAQQSQRASDIVSELMDFANPPEPVPDEIDPGELLAEAAKVFCDSDHAQAASAKVDIQTGGQVPHIWADRAQIRKVLGELLSNAATSAGTDPHIRLSAAADEGGSAVVLTVADNGPGMDAETLAHAFTPFYSSHHAGRRRGLGLPRARRYVEKNGGTMWIDSAAATGTTVTFRLPAAPSRGGGV